MTVTCVNLVPLVNRATQFKQKNIPADSNVDFKLFQLIANFLSIKLDLRSVPMEEGGVPRTTLFTFMQVIVVNRPIIIIIL